MGPVWGFNGAASHSSDINMFLMKDSPLYSDLFKNGTFDRKLLQRYSVLRESLLSDENISRLITEARDYLGNALQRDLSLRRAGIDANMEETSVLLDNLIQRGIWLDENISSLGDNAETTYKYAVISAAEITLTVCFFAAAAALYKKLKGRAKVPLAGKAET